MKKTFIILIILSLLVIFSSCGAKNEEMKNDISSDNEIETPISDTVEDEKEEAETVDSVIVVDETAPDDFVPEIQEDDNTFVWTFDGITYVYTHDGENVTDYEIYIKMDSNNEVKNMISEYLMLEKKGDEIKSLEPMGRYLHIVFNESGFDYKTYDEVKTASDYFKRFS